MLNRELLQQALDALTKCANYLDELPTWSACGHEANTAHAAITALREALAAPMPEPVAWRWLDEDWYETIQSVKPYHDAEPLYAAPAPVDTEGCVACVTCGQPWPAAPVVREPLTDDFIWLLWTRACEKPRLTRDLVCDFARAIEGGGK